MATVKLILYNYKASKKAQEVPLYIRITHRRKNKYTSLGIKVNPEKDWDAKRLRVKKSYPNATKVNNYIAQKLVEAEAFALDLESNTQTLDSNRIKHKLMGNSTQCFIDFSELQIHRFRQAGQIGTANRYQSILNKLRRFLNGRSFTFNDLTVSFLYEYEAYLKTLGNNTNTIHNNLKSLRAILYTAIREDHFPQEKNPFFKFKLKKAPVKKDRLNTNEMERISQVSLTENSSIWHTRNAFLFSFYCAGIRIGDLLQLKWKNVAEGLQYKMGKTQQYRRLKLVRQAVRILDHYKTNPTELERYIFPFLKPSPMLSDPDFLLRQIASKTVIFNNNLQLLAQKASIDKKISSHLARHSFADIARKKGMKLYDISKALGHSSLSITEQYLSNFDDSALDDAMEQVFG